LEYVTRFISPYDLFLGFSEYLELTSHQGSIPLDKYVCLAYEYFSLIRGVDKMKLRDLMILDRISTNNSDVIPVCLKVKDDRLRKLRRLVGKNCSCVILYSENIAVYCDYNEKKDPVTGQWKIKRINSIPE
jgi:hypothetical protein